MIIKIRLEQRVIFNFVTFSFLQLQQAVKHKEDESFLLLGSFLIKFSPLFPTTGSLVKGEDMYAVSVVASQLSCQSVRLVVQKTVVQIPAMLRWVFSSDVAVSSSIFVGEKGESLMK